MDSADSLQNVLIESECHEGTLLDQVFQLRMIDTVDTSLILCHDAGPQQAGYVPFFSCRHQWRGTGGTCTPGPACERSPALGEAWCCHAAATAGGTFWQWVYFCDVNAGCKTEKWDLWVKACHV
jgi:hypothetical protein